jgi:hypothetical protein
VYCLPKTADKTTALEIDHIKPIISLAIALITFLKETFATNRASSIASDFVVVGVVLLVWYFKEAKRLNMRGWCVFFSYIWYSVRICNAIIYVNP